MKFNGRLRRVDGKTPRYGRQREKRCTPTRAKAQDTRASPNSLETHLVRTLDTYGRVSYAVALYQMQMPYTAVCTIFRKTSMNSGFSYKTHLRNPEVRA